MRNQLQVCNVPFKKCIFYKLNFQYFQKLGTGMERAQQELSIKFIKSDLQKMIFTVLPYFSVQMFAITNQSLELLW